MGQKGIYFSIMCFVFFLIYLLHFSFKCSQRCFVVFCCLFSLLPMTGIDFKYWFSFVTEKKSLCFPFQHVPFGMNACWGSHIATLFCRCWYYFNKLQCVRTSCLPWFTPTSTVGSSQFTKKEKLSTRFQKNSLKIFGDVFTL